MIDIIEYIPIGRENAITRKELSNILHVNDRQVRKLIETARENNVIVNLSDSKGYFIPDENDDMYVRAYIRQEIARINHIEKSIKYARFLYS